MTTTEEENKQISAITTPTVDNMVPKLSLQLLWSLMALIICCVHHFLLIYWCSEGDEASS